MSLPAGTVSKSGRPGQLLRRGMPGRISLCFAKFAFEDSMWWFATAEILDMKF